MAIRFSLCSRQQLESALADRLSVAESQLLGEHLQGCAHCRTELELLAGTRDWWHDAKSYLSSSDEVRMVDDDSAARREPIATPAVDGAAVASDDDADPPLDFLDPSTNRTSLGRLGSYEVERVVGRGGMGIVLKAQDTALSRPVAIKALVGHLAASGAARKRFAGEAKAAAAVVHDHVIPIHTVDTAGKTPYLVMPYIDGGSLQDRLDACGPLDVKETLRIALQTAEGLAAAHAQGLVHRDIKPANILLENGVERVRITDFGLARAVDDASQTQSGFIAGTPQYMAPEQARGEPIDARADLFSLGSVMYAMCTGHPPFRAETTLAVLRRICDDRARDVREANPDVPAWLAAIVHKLLAKSRAERFQSAEEVAETLRQWLAHLQQPTVVPPPVVVVGKAGGKGSSKPERGRTSGSMWLAIAAGGGVLALVMLVGLVAALQQQDLPSAHSAGLPSRSFAATAQGETPAEVDAGALPVPGRATRQSPIASIPTTHRARDAVMPPDAADAEIEQAKAELLAAEARLRAAAANDAAISRELAELREELDRLERGFLPEPASAVTTSPAEPAASF